jgi:hypothetical protein
MGLIAQVLGIIIQNPVVQVLEKYLAAAPVSEANPPVSGANPPVSGANPPVSGANPPVSGANPPVFGANPPVSGANPPVSEANPVMGCLHKTAKMGPIFAVRLILPGCPSNFCKHLTDEHHIAQNRT